MAKQKGTKIPHEAVGHTVENLEHFKTRFTELGSESFSVSKDDLSLRTDVNRIARCILRSRHPTIQEWPARGAK